METISAANALTLQILRRFRRQASEVRLMKYCVRLSVDENVLLFNLLTRELLLLSRVEYQNLTALDELRERWFLVPKQTNEKELVDFVRLVLTTHKMHKKKNNITGYTIFTTTDCNARCFYCFQKGSPRISMTHETALKVVQYIKAHCGGEKVKIMWFGGEPLLNDKVIDTISTGLRREGIRFTSTMLTNGYLFDDKIIHKAISNWNLKNVQFAMDGVGLTYNRIKAYIYPDGNAYQTVCCNIEALLDASIRVVVRMNMGLYNAKDVLALVDDLGQRFGGRPGFSMYAQHIYERGKATADTHNEDDWEKWEQVSYELRRHLNKWDVGSKARVKKELPLNQCMADGGNCVTITPKGELGLCGLYNDSEFIGHIDHEELDRRMMDSWRERAPETLECRDCILYPNCLRLKKCSTTSICFPQYRTDELWKVKQSMTYEYERWKSQQTSEETEEDELC